MFQILSLILSALIALAFPLATAASSDQEVQQDLEHSHDVLLKREDDLKRSYDQTLNTIDNAKQKSDEQSNQEQIDRLNDKKVKLESDLQRTEQSLDDIENSLRNLR